LIEMQGISAVAEGRLAEPGAAAEGRLAEPGFTGEDRLAERSAAAESHLVEPRLAAEGRLAEPGVASEGRLAEPRVAGEGRPVERGVAGEGRPVQPGVAGEGRLVERGVAGEGRLVERGVAGEGRLAESGVAGEGRLAERGDAHEGGFVEPGVANEGHLAELGVAVERRPAEAGTAAEGRLAEQGVAPEGGPAEICVAAERRPAEQGVTAEGRSAESGVAGEGCPAERSVAAKGRSAEPGVAAEGRPVEVDAAGEGRPVEVGGGHHAVYEAEIDEGGAAEIETNGIPETRARRIAGLMIFGPVITQMLGKDTLRGKTHLPFLLPCAANPSLCFTVNPRLFPAFGGLGLRVAGWRRGGERHAQVGADDVDDGLAVCRVVLSEPFECVQAAGPDQGLVAAELLNRLGVELGDAPLGRVKVAQNYRDLLVVSAEGEHPQPVRPRPPRWPGTLMCPSAVRKLHGEHHLAAIMSIAGGQRGPAAARAALVRCRCQRSPGPLAVPWSAIPGRRGLPGAHPRAAADVKAVADSQAACPGGSCAGCRGWPGKSARGVQITERRAIVRSAETQIGWSSRDCRLGAPSDEHSIGTQLLRGE